MRLIHAVRDLNAQTGADPGSPPIEVVALYTEAEHAAMFVREADVAHPLGPASARPYLDLEVLERALVATRADAVWVGWGFVAEDPAFADLCERIGVTFIGPSADAMRKLGGNTVKSTPEQFRAQINQEIEQWKPLIKEIAEKEKK